MASHQILGIYFICFLWYVVSCYVKPNLPSAKCKLTELVVDRTCEQCYENIPVGKCNKFKCQDHNCKPETFSCYYVRKSGFDMVRDVLETYNKTDEYLPELKRITWYKRPFNNSEGKTLGNPALSVSVKLPCCLHSGKRRSGSTNLLLMQFRSVEDKVLRDDYYYRHTIHRLYNFTGLFRTTNDCHVDKLVSFNCLLGLDVCGDRRAYIVDVTAYAPEPQLYSTQRYMVTTFNTQTEWMPAIAVTYRTNVVYVIFQADPSAVKYDVILMDCDDGSAKTTSVSENQDAQKACDAKSIIREEKGLKFDTEDYKEVKFEEIPHGRYKVRITVMRLLSKTYESNVMIFGKIVDVPKTEEKQVNTEKTFIWVSTIGGGCLLAVILLIILYLLRRKPLKGDVTVKVFILYSNHYERDINMAKAFENFLHKLDGVEVLFDKVDKKYMQGPIKVHKEKMAACTHVMVIWSPGAREALSGGFLSQPETAVQDLFKSSLSWFSNLEEKEAFIVYLPEYEEIESLRRLPTVLRSVKKFNIIKDKEVKKLCKHLIGKIPDNLFTKAERREAVNEIRKKVNKTDSHSIEESDIEHSELLSDSRKPPVTICPVHGRNVINLNGAIPKIRKYVPTRYEQKSRTVHTNRNFREESPEVTIHANGTDSCLNNSRPNNYHHQQMKQIDSEETFLLPRQLGNRNLQNSVNIVETMNPDSFESYSSESFSSLGEEMVRINAVSLQPSLSTCPYNASANSLSHITENPENIVLHDHARHILPCMNITSDELDEMDKHTSGYGTTSFQNQNMELQNHHYDPNQTLINDVANGTFDNSNDFPGSLSSQGDDSVIDSNNIMDLMLKINDMEPW